LPNLSSYSAPPVPAPELEPAEPASAPGPLLALHPELSPSAPQLPQPPGNTIHPLLPQLDPVQLDPVHAAASAYATPGTGPADAVGERNAAGERAKSIAKNPIRIIAHDPIDPRALCVFLRTI
jgi:hypothetical protein